MKVTVTLADLNKAIEARENGGVFVSRSCVMAQAYMRKFKTPVMTAGGFVRVGKRDYRTSQKADRLIGWFDNRRYDLLRKHLPTVVTITPE